MKAQELRIGNLICSIGTDDIGIYTIKEINKNYVIGKYEKVSYRMRQTFDGMAGISLTEEWLLKFGFNKINITDGYFNTNDGDIIYGKPDEYSEEGLYYISFGEDSSFCMSEYGCLRYFEYVHQLQNLYFALTGEELICKNL